MLTYDQIVSIQNDFLQEAENSPRLLTDMAAMESYLAESYGQRILIELLQNADDAQSKNATLIKFGNAIIFANDGRPFSADDLTAICRSGASKKSRGSDIGYRGIGFKSTTALTDNIVTVSDHAIFEFSKAKVAETLKADIGQVPTVRVPLALEEKDLLPPQLSKIQELRANGYTTIFIFQTAKSNIVDEELQIFDISSLLFLRNISCLTIGTKSYHVQRQSFSHGAMVTLSSDGNSSQWWLPFENCEYNFAFKVDNNRIVACNQEDALFHCYLPTLEASPFRFKINADFSTDPSRKHITFDSRTNEHIQALVQSLSLLCKTALDQGLPFDGLFDVLATRNAYNSIASQFYDLFRKNIETIALELNSGETVSLQDYRVFGDELTASEKSFVRKTADHFIKQTCRTAGTGFDLFAEQYSNNYFTEQDYLCCLKDYAFVSKCHDTFLAKLYSIVIHAFFQLSKISKAVPSFSGCMLICDNPSPVSSISQDQLPTEYVEELKLLITKEEWTWFAKMAEVKLDIFKKAKAKIVTKNKGITLTKWKSAEEQCAEIEAILGNVATCVGAKNLGYDVLSETPDGKMRYIEVKLLTSDLGSFSLTNNEYSTAHQLGEEFYLCLLVQRSDGISATYIKNPIENLQLEKRVRQWEWVCNEFDGDSFFYPY